MALLWLAAAVVDAGAATYPLPPPDQSLVGQLQEARVRPGDTLLDIARRYDVGVASLEDANPGVDPWLPPVGQRVVIPSQYLLPDVPRRGIVVNLPELRLYYYPPAAPGQPRVVKIYPLGIGSEGRAIPVAETRIIGKQTDPPWVVPKSILAEHAAEGDPLPKVVPPGPDNPLGRYALRLGLPGFLIHSTNHPYSVGMRISHGCLRMYPEDIEKLYRMVAVGTPVRVIDVPYKVAWQGDTLYLEAHPPLAENGPGPDTDLTPMVSAITAVVKGRLEDGAWRAAARIVTRGTGIPTPIVAGPAEAAREAPAAPSDAERWVVQVGAFNNLSRAKRITRMMRRLSLPVETSTAGESHPCRVWVGPFDSRQAAADTGDRIYRRTGLENVLVAVKDPEVIACR
jgi:L,D-transpeptidase ErfK/SrfK